MNFLASIQKCIPTIAQLLGSKNISDVLEGIDFFVTGFEFGMTDTMVGIRRMLVLIWSKEQVVKEAVVNAYRRLYMNSQSTNARYICVTDTICIQSSLVNPDTSVTKYIVRISKSAV
jgi:condensin complex subunit 1